ncbi:hypothetical protein GYMLUDRAFT_233573 [Collybiopsis luxurians FD-317 M1]|uniref:DUF6534 domain-containing protein n=1 Tax=Collybiopsis luxurians FD-317 M1 TaxID=944289 RepID=A0A0D0BCH3_9AGAR|nr:hypothetical protein GYMLUDRAFT_233573 [Collybiopsis luxurians FD-317 M1]
MTSIALDFDDLLGTLLLGTWASSMLYAVILKETWSYFNNFSRDGFGLKLLVAVTVLCDTVALAGSYATVYLYTISHWGDLSYLTKQYWPVVLFAASTGVSSALVQGFLIVRYYSLSHDWLCTIVVLVLIGFALATCEASAVIFALFPDYTERYKSRVTVIAWLSSSTATDIIISLALIWQLYNMKTSFSGTKSLIRRLITQTIQTGSASSIVAVCTLIAFLKNENSNVEAMLAFVLGKVYVITLLANINMRKQAPSKDVNFTNEHLMRKTAPMKSSISADSIQIHRTVVRMSDQFDVDSSPASVTNVNSKSIKGSDYISADV